MRMSHIKSNKLKKKAEKLFHNGLSNKEISKELKVTEKTISNWLKPYKDHTNLLTETQNLLLERINKVLKDPKTTSEEIKNLSYSLTQIRSFRSEF